MSEPSGRIHWPDEFRPESCAVHVRNELQMKVPAERVWDALVHAKRWPEWYPNAKKVVLRNQEGERLEKGTVFRWSTFGVRITSEVVEYEPEERIAWTGKAPGLWVYHAWLLEKTEAGCRVLTEETQHGVLCRLSALLFPRRMWKFHQLWLETMERRAASRQWQQTQAPHGRAADRPPLGTEIRPDRAKLPMRRQVLPPVAREPDVGPRSER